MEQELIMQKDYLKGQEVQSIYFGGGTPSIAPTYLISRLLDACSAHFTLSPDTQISLEANPDDLSWQKLEELKKAGIQRLSIGIQSFNNNVLAWMNRAHTAEMASTCVKQAKELGFEKINVDIIYGVPIASHELLKQDLQQFLDLQIGHISAYCLSIEPKTVFGNWSQKGKLQEIEESYAAEQFEIVRDTLQQAGFVHYEISNYAKNGEYSVHNVNYWNRGWYLGIGPGAHSYQGEHRQANIRNNALYCKAIEKGVIPAERELLSPIDQVNEYLLTSLRTRWGCNLRFIQENYGLDFEVLQANTIASLQQRKLLVIEKEWMKLTEAARLLADAVTVELFLEN